MFATNPTETMLHLCQEAAQTPETPSRNSNSCDYSVASVGHPELIRLCTKRFAMVSSWNLVAPHATSSMFFTRWSGCGTGMQEASAAMHMSIRTVPPPEYPLKQLCTHPIHCICTFTNVPCRNFMLKYLRAIAAHLQDPCKP